MNTAMSLRRSLVPPFPCPACGSTWFREVQFSELPPEWTDAALVLQLANLPILLVCLCGYPVPPIPLDSKLRLSNPLACLMRSLNLRQENLQALIPLEFLPTAVARGQLPAMEQRMQQLDTALQPIREKRKRAAAGPKTRGRDWLEGELQKKGLSDRKAHAMVQAIFEALAEGIRKDEKVETPIGTFSKKKRTHEYERERFGKKQYVHQTPWRIEFESAPGLCDKKP